MNDEAEELLNMFQKMGTTDHETLMAQFVTIVPDVERDIARFFLEANNWTLQNALASYFENNGTDFKKQIAFLTQKPLKMTFEEKEGPIQVFVGTVFKKTWLLKNTGETVWPNGCTINLVSGSPLDSPTSYSVPSLLPGQVGSFSIEFRAPLIPGDYHGCWSMRTTGDNPISFGEALWVIVSVLSPPIQNPTPNLGFQQPTFFYGNNSPGNQFGSQAQMQAHQLQFAHPFGQQPQQPLVQQFGGQQQPFVQQFVGQQPPFGQTPHLFGSPTQQQTQLYAQQQQQQQLQQQLLPQQQQYLQQQLLPQQQQYLQQQLQQQQQQLSQDNSTRPGGQQNPL